MPCFNTCLRPEGKVAPLSCHSLIRYWISNMASDAKVSFSSKVEYGAVIRYLYLKGKTGQEIHCEMTNVYGSSAPLYAQVKFWVGEFKCSRTSLEEETRSGLPSDATDEEMCNKARDLVYSDRWIKVEEIANALQFSHGSISTTLHDRLGMHKITARWVPKSLSDEQMATRASVYSALSRRFRSKEDDFLSCLVTVDETWVHYYEPENKTQSPVGWAGVSKTKELQNATLCWQGDGNCILGCTRCYYVGLSSKPKYNNRCVLCKFAWLTELWSVKNAEVNSPKGFCSNRTMRESTLPNCDGCCWAEWVRANTAPRLFSGLSS